MIPRNDFITMSLDLNLFYLRIMKEHSFFLEIAFTPVNSQMASTAKDFRNGFEKLLSEATSIANRNVSRKAVESRQFVTQYTVKAERLTNFYTGVPFNTNLTKSQLMLMPDDRHISLNEHAVDSLNYRSYRLTAALADFKERLLHNVIECKVFTLNYPLLIEHILRETKLFMSLLNKLGDMRDYMNPSDLINQEVFWNRQMAEHAKFIAGLLDPSEEELINTARMFGKEFDILFENSKKALNKSMDISNVTRDSISATERLREFKIAGTKGLLDCNIRSIIIPLLGDHVMREANHYLCLLGVCNLEGS